MRRSLRGANLRFAAPEVVGAMEELAERSNRVDAEKAYRRLKGPVLVKARHWFPTLPESDLEDVYQSAWLSVVRTPASVGDLQSYLFEAVHSEGLSELRRRRRRAAMTLSELEAERAEATGHGSD